MISVFGASGFIGGRYVEMFSDKCIRIHRNDIEPKSSESLYFISTVHNYNVFHDPLLDINTNLCHLVKVLEKHKNINSTFNFISSWFVYGQNHTLPFKETDFCNPTGFYSITKRCAEQMVISFCKTFNINYRIFRLSNVIGEQDTKACKEKNALQFMIKELCNNRDIELYNNGEHLRDYMYIDDVCNAIDICLKNSPTNEIINIGSGKPNKIRTLINHAKLISGSKSSIKNIQSSKFHKIVQVQDSYLDISKLESYGYKPNSNMDTIIKNLVNHYKKQIQQ